MRSWPSPDLGALGATPGRLRLYDTAAAQLVPVGPGPGESRAAKLYVCGITPYEATHLGHAFTYLTFDLVVRVWHDLGVRVEYDQNVTDVDDPLLERASALAIDWEELAASQIAVFRSDMETLRMVAPKRFLSVTESLPAIEDCLVRLRDKAEIYQVAQSPADWYCSFENRAGFGAVSHQTAEAMLALFAERGGDPERGGKNHPLDALVWRLARPGEPAWPSSLGRGRPGWHIECAAIALANLGPTIDLQGGGADLIFPHHEMSASVAEILTGRPFARAFLHSAMVGLDGEKMSKSKGNLVKVADLLRLGVEPMAIRLALLAHHYREDWIWSVADLVQAEQRLSLWRAAVQGETSCSFAPTARAVRDHLLDDLRVDDALGELDVWARASLACGEDQPKARAQMAELADRLLGVALI